MWIYLEFFHNIFLGATPPVPILLVTTCCTPAYIAASIWAGVRRWRTTLHVQFSDFFKRRCCRIRGALQASGFLGAAPPVDIRFPCFRLYMFTTRHSKATDDKCGCNSSLYTDRHVPREITTSSWLATAPYSGSDPKVWLICAFANPHAAGYRHTDAHTYFRFFL
jgi:hypothetical protein